MLRIRRPSLSDLPGIMRVERASFPDPWPGLAFVWYLFSGDSLFLVAEEDGEIRGFAIAVMEGEALHLHDIAVLPASRQRGIGRKLMEALMQKGREKKAKKVVLETRVENLVAQAFFRRFGFKETGVIPNYYEPGDAILMELEL
ncbi:ribosomal protein S18-alanine N-acetyltransferase [Candidatus Bipolaricaulota bacterium]|nr:ribosomal protein S18-alanine N-acetyltransferase [Candidatus Bipolaricaulota bacterium]